MDVPERPQGRHMLQLRTHLGLNQTDFGSLLRSAQSTVSQWETQRRDDPLPPDLAERLLELWDCFANGPTPEDFDEAIALLSDYRRQKMASPAPILADAKQPTEDTVTWPILLARGPLPPGAILVETGPLVPVDAAAPMTRTFAAVERKESAPAHEAGEIAEVPTSATVLSASREHARPISWRALRFDTLVLARWATAASLVLLLIPVGCFQGHGRVSRGEVDRPAAEREREPAPIPGQIYTDDAQQGIGAAVAPKRSIPLPKKPYSWQKVAPCDSRYEAEKVGGCWWAMEARPPCPDYAVEDSESGKCFVPVPARPKPPNTVIPVK